MRFVPYILAAVMLLTFPKWLLADEFRGFHYHADIDAAGIFVITGQEYDYETGQCEVDGYFMQNEEIRIGAFEEYVDGHLWILPPQALFPIPINRYEETYECYSYQNNEATPSGRLALFLLRFLLLL